MLRRQIVRKKSTKLKRQKVDPWLAHAGGGTHNDDPLFEQLRAWRAELARTQGVPAYAILHDKTLRELAAERPTSIDDLQQISGIGAAKIERYGAALLELLGGG